MTTNNALTFTVTNAQIANVNMTTRYGKVQITTDDKVYTFSEFMNALRMHGIEDLDGRTIVRGSDMEKWSEHRIANDSTIALACAVIRGIKKIRVGLMDEYAVNLVIKDEAPQAQPAAAAPQATHVSKEHLHAVIDKISGLTSGVFMKDRFDHYMLMDTREAHAWLGRGAQQDMWVRVTIGNLATYLPLTQIAPMIDVSPVNNTTETLAKLFATLITAITR